MAQTPRTLTPHASGWDFLGAELRCWRQHRGMSLAQLARQVYVSPDLLAKVEKAHRRPTLDLTGRCDTTLDTGGALTRLWRFIHHQTTTQPPLPTPTVLVKLVTELCTPGPSRPEPASAAPGSRSPRLYAVPDGQQW